jgi:DNA-binding SARP family transcriptional activator/tetratricopeptide (TPR) repeat protein
MRVSKIQPPALREEVLSRTRLLDWLDAKIHRRVVTVVAEAGYGKTTLLADFARRTRMRVVWHQLDDDDHDVVTFVRYLLMACRHVAPEIGETTAGLLREIGTLATPASALVDTLVRDMADLADQPTVLVFDDVQSLERAPEVQRALREIVARAPDRTTIVLSGRRRPPVGLSRLRTHGEVAELTADDLRFDHEETETLFRETYGRPLDRDSLAALERRTDGWIASLNLVRAAIRDRSDAEVRRFIRELSAAEGPLYDYLAEEVVGDLDVALRSFLMRTALLVDVEVALGAVAAEVDRTVAEASIQQAERVGLLSAGRGRAGRTGAQYHPLVRQFLTARLTREIGAAAVRDIHRRIAAAAEATDWRRAAHHYAEAGDGADLHRVLVDATRSIMASGDYSFAENYIGRFPDADETPWFDIVLSRRELRSGRVDDAVRRAERAVAALQSTGPDRHLALANLMTVRLNHGDVVAALETAAALSSEGADAELDSMAAAMVALLESSQSRSVVDVIERFESLAHLHSPAGAARFRGVSLLNLAYALLAHGDLQRALDVAGESVDTLDPDSRSEAANARVVRATVLAHLGRSKESQADLDAALAGVPDPSGIDVVLEAADVTGAYRDPAVAVELLEGLLRDVDSFPKPAATAVRMVTSHNLLRAGRVVDAKAMLELVDDDQFMPFPGARSRIAAIHAHIAATEGRPDAKAQALEAAARGRSAGALFWARYAEAVAGLRGDSSEMQRTIVRLADTDPGLLCLVSDVVVASLGQLATDTLDQLEEAASGFEPRWRRALRTVLDGRVGAGTLPAALWLDRIGEHEDVARLRAVARRLGARGQGSELGRTLARRLAPRVFVEDQGPVEIIIGRRGIAGTSLRRKVLALLCFLVTRPDLAATREQALDALWPDLDPELGSNSLNQTVYFLRRVFEAMYSDDTSPGYVKSDTEMVWLDKDLVSSRSRECGNLLRLARHGDDAAVLALAGAYRARFALDFTYEEWAGLYRDSLHSQYLETMEREIGERTAAGDFAAAIDLARAVIDVDDGADAVEVALIRLYKSAGAHAAAAELYGRYAAVQRSEYGAEVPPLSDI